MGHRHTARTTQTWLRNNAIRRTWYVADMSPDMNPVEHVWPLVLDDLEAQVFSRREAPWAGLQAAFSRVPPYAIQGLYKSMVRRMAAVMVDKAGHTKY